MSQQLEKLKRLLRELFQLDQSELDFGIYRIMNQKRGEIENFLDNQLLPQVQHELQRYEDTESSTLKEDLEKATQQAKEMGMDPDQVPKVCELKEKLEQGTDIEALEAQVYSDLYNFFRRYYSNGDFISQRRYKDGVYAIPYEGEEVKLYWANYDQYYIKSSEYLQDYTFKLGYGGRVHLKVIEAGSESNNNEPTNGNERRYILCDDSPVLEENGELYIRFVYQPDPDKRSQAELNLDATKRILRTEGLGKWESALQEPRPTEKNKNRTILEKHINDFTARNTFDYFIHKDLGGFLRRELDFYIKNEIMHLDDIESESAPKVEQYLSKVRAMKRIGGKIIQFLEQLENFQKKLWLKKKFVVETNYCITLDRVPKELYPRIVENDAQREEWVKLFSINEIEGDLSTPGYSNPLTEDFLEANPYLVLDTKFFDEDFKNQLLASIHDFDEQLEGVLIHGENFQALNLMQERYKEQVKCIHIDPPYNTNTSGFMYKNNYQHSSWISFMNNRIHKSMKLMNDQSNFLCHIDENEYERLYSLFEMLEIPNAGTLVWDKRNPMNGGIGLANQHEYVIWRTYQQGPIYARNKNVLSMLNKVKDLIKDRDGIIDDEVRKKYVTWLNNNNKLSGGEKAYRYIDDEGNIFQSVSLRAPEPRQDKKFYIPLIHPITKKPCAMPPNGFSRTPETLKSMRERGEIIFGKDETTQPRQKVYLSIETKKQLTSILKDGKKGKAYTSPLGLDFPYCHPCSFYKELIGGITNDNDTILDYFAGSGTTAHAVINLNREDDGKRKYILVEVGDYFDTVLKPRIQKVVYSKDWKDGKPVSREGSSHCFKYLRLESYEDTLNNLQLKRTKAQQETLETIPDDMFYEEYMLSYMLDVESQGSSSLLNLNTFENPFDYKLNIAIGDVGETKPTNIDLIETFNYLIGLKIKHIDHIKGIRVIEGENLKGERILVLWRNCKDISNQDLDTFFQKQGYNTKDQEYDIIYVNGDNNLENLRREDQTWKVRLIEEEFKRLMFDVKDI